eukprot:TRINITY_DN14380_c0_g1_i1.p1 TRINITY_DN14380_c0_g1~~TRINITY_DN14380_c0_g1_i1.p1  ORF type:complete len:683 (+),score=164.98 TRINITY_DN14380_c0_g1_i1:247-2295(+)
MYLVAVDDVNDGLRPLDSIPVPDEVAKDDGADDREHFNVHTLFAKKFTKEEIDESKAALTGETTVYQFQVPDPTLVAAGDTDCNLQLNIASAKGENTKISIIIPHLNLNAKAPGKADVQLHALEAKVVITAHKGQTKYLIAEASETSFSGDDVKMEIEIFAKRLLVESAFTGTGQRSAWLLFMTDPSKDAPFFALQKTFDRDKNMAFDMGSTLLEISWSAVVLHDVIETVKGITKFSLGSAEGDRDAQLESNMLGLKIDILNLIPTFGVLNRTREIFNPLGPKDSNWPAWKRALWQLALIVWFFATFDMLFALVGFGLLMQLGHFAGNALEMSGAGPSMTTLMNYLQLLPLALLNLMMPGIMHALLGYYDKRNSLLSGLVCLAYTIYLAASTRHDDWPTSNDPTTSVIVLSVCLAIHLGVGLMSSYSRYKEFGAMSLFDSSLATNSTVGLRSPWHHRCIATWPASILLIWLSAGGLYIKYGNDNSHYCDTNTPCKFGGFNTYTQCSRLVAGVITLGWNIALLKFNKEDALKVNLSEDDEPSSYGAVALESPSSPGLGDAKADKDDHHIQLRPSGHHDENGKLNYLPPQLVDRAVNDAADDLKAFHIGLNAYTAKIGMSLLLVIDMLLALGSVILLASRNSKSDHDWTCNSCKMLYFHALSWIVVAPYLLTHVWISMWDQLLA